MDIKRHQEVSHEVDLAFSEALEEYTAAAQYLNEKSDVLRIRCLIAFSLIEFLSNIYNVYFPPQRTNKVLFPEWITKYCLTNDNETYATHPYINRITSQHMYLFRNSIMHNFALPEPENGISISVLNGGAAHPSIADLDREFKAKGHTCAFVSPNDLMALFLKGAELMHPHIFKSPSTATQGDLDRMEALLKEFGRRGAKKIDLKKFVNSSN